MCPFVYFQILWAREHLATSREGAREGFLSRVDSNVIHQFVFCLEGLALPWTVIPKADVVTLFGTADMLRGHMRDQLVHSAISFTAAFFWVTKLLRVDPFTNELLFDALLSHVAEESAGMVRHVHTHI